MIEVPKLGEGKGTAADVLFLIVIEVVGLQVLPRYGYDFLQSLGIPFVIVLATWLIRVGFHGTRFQIVATALSLPSTVLYLFIAAAIQWLNSWRG